MKLRKEDKELLNKIILTKKEEVQTKASTMLPDYVWLKIFKTFEEQRLLNDTDYTNVRDSISDELIDAIRGEPTDVEGLVKNAFDLFYTKMQEDVESI